MTVSQLLDSVSSWELAEWQAFEIAFGPIGNEWRDDTLASIQEQLQYLCSIYGQGTWGDDNPVPNPERRPRPNEVHNAVEETDEGMDREEFDRQEFG